MLHLTENNPRALLKLIAKQQDKLYEAYQQINAMKRKCESGTYEYIESPLKDDIDKLAKVLNNYV